MNSIQRKLLQCFAPNYKKKKKKGFLFTWPPLKINKEKQGEEMNNFLNMALNELSEYRQLNV